MFAMHRWTAAILLAASPSLALAAGDADLEAIRAQIQSLKQDYDALLTAAKKYRK